MKTTRIYTALTGFCLITTSAHLLADDWQFTLQGGAANAPRYSGSSERSTAPVLGFEIESPYGFFLKEKGLGWKQEWDDASFSTYIGTSDERKDRKKGYRGSDRLRGMGSIKSRALVGMEGSYTWGPLTFGATFEHALKKDSNKDTGSAYQTLELSVGTSLYEGDFGSLTGNVNALFGDADYVRTWYGVSEQQAANSRFAAHKTHGGLVSQGVNLTWSLPLGENTRLHTLLDVQNLSGHVSDSPIVDRRVQTSIASVLEYSF
ncbi:MULTISPECIES: MipA/OmpV family protein [Pseudomonas]|uniref:MipA/OmpV family protein n=1 Tax=Pseudomonas TaxID=286 RepID=UPI00132F425A|nr:structural protein MipA [Pseudomonas sp. R32]